MKKFVQFSTPRIYNWHASKKHFSEITNGNHLETTTLKEVLTLEETSVELLKVKGH